MHVARTGTTHEVRADPETFGAILRGERRHDLRRDAEGPFLPGDRLLMREWDAARDAATGRELALDVSYVTSAGNPCALSPDGLAPGFSILSLEPAA